MDIKEVYEKYKHLDKAICDESWQSMGARIEIRHVAGDKGRRGDRVTGAGEKVNASQKPFPPERFVELTDEELRGILDRQLSPQWRRYRTESVTWCVNGKKWLIKLERREA